MGCCIERIHEAQAAGTDLERAWQSPTVGPSGDRPRSRTEQPACPAGPTGLQSAGNPVPFTGQLAEDTPPRELSRRRIDDSLCRKQYGQVGIIPGLRPAAEIGGGLVEGAVLRPRAAKLLSGRSLGVALESARPISSRLALGLRS